jgi:hypothetical protein
MRLDSSLKHAGMTKGKDENHAGPFSYGVAGMPNGRGHGPLLRQDDMLRGMEFYINGMPE